MLLCSDTIEVNKVSLILINKMYVIGSLWSGSIIGKKLGKCQKA